MNRRPILSVALLALCVQSHATQAAKPAAPSATPPPPCCVVPAPAPPAAPDIRGTRQQPLAVEVGNFPPPPAPPKDRSGWVIACATVALAAVTAALATYTYLLWRSNSQLITQAAETAARQLRAYVAVNEPRIFNVRADMSPRLRIPFENFGQTPAYKFSVTYAFCYAPGGDFSVAPPLQESDRRLACLAPGARRTTIGNCPLTLSPALYVALKNGASALFVYGIARYSDAFGKDHFTRFRLKVSSSLGTRLTYCAGGNETDDEV